MHFLEAFPAASELQSARQGTPRRLESQSSQRFSGDRGRTHTGDKRFSEVRELLETMCCIWACRSCDRGGFSSLNSIKSQLLQCCRLSRPGSSPLSSVRASRQGSCSRLTETEKGFLNTAPPALPRVVEALIPVVKPSIPGMYSTASVVLTDKTQISRHYCTAAHRSILLQQASIFTSA